MNSLYCRSLIAICLASAFVCGGATAEDDASPMQVQHLNVVFAANDEAAVHQFYGDVLGLKRIADIDFPGDSKMIRYMGGDSEIKFIVSGRKLAKRENTQRGIQLLAFLLPDAEREAILSRLEKSGYEAPDFNQSGAVQWGMTRDGEGNRIELVFFGDGTDPDYREIQIGLAAADMTEMDEFLSSVLGLTPKAIEGPVHRYAMGVSQIKFWAGKPDAPTREAGPMAKSGLNLIQFLVPDVDAVREVLENGGKIHTEPFALGELATIMFVEGPDGVIFEFGGPLLERLRK